MKIVDKIFENAPPASSGGGGIGGAGTVHYIPVFSPDGHTLANSKLYFTGAALQSADAFFADQFLIPSFDFNNRILNDNSGNPLLYYSNGFSVIDMTVGMGGGALPSNTVFGASAFVNNISGVRDVAIGVNTLIYNSDGTDNTGVGYYSLSQMAHGVHNTAVGAESLVSALSSYNAAVGSQAGSSLNTGERNSFLGMLAGLGIASGSNNVYIGQASQGSSGSSASIMIGSQGNNLFNNSIVLGTYASATANHQFVLGSANGGANINEHYFGAGVYNNSPTFWGDVLFTVAGASPGISDLSANYRYILAGAKGTGTGLGGSVVIQVAPAGSTGSTQNGLVDVMEFMQDGRTKVHYPFIDSFSFSSIDINNRLAFDAAGLNTIDWSNKALISDWVSENFSVSKTLHTAMGSSIASANNLTVGVGNSFIVSGSTQINQLDASTFTAGDTVVFLFSGSPKIKHGFSATGLFANFLLSGNADFQAHANSTLTVLFDGSSWQEVSRKTT